MSSQYTIKAPIRFVSGALRGLAHEYAITCPPCSVRRYVQWIQSHIASGMPVRGCVGKSRYVFTGKPRITGFVP